MTNAQKSVVIVMTLLCLAILITVIYKVRKSVTPQEKAVAFAGEFTEDPTEVKIAIGMTEGEWRVTQYRLLKSIEAKLDKRK